MIKRLSLFTALSALAACGGTTTVNPCDGKDGTCLTVRVVGDVGTVDKVRLELSGAISHSIEPQLSRTPTSLPVAIGVKLPATTSGTIKISGAVLLAGTTVGTGSTEVTVTPGMKSTVTLTVTANMASCTDGVTDGDETDVDCGGGCPSGCVDGKLCTKASDCVSMTCTAGHCAGGSCTDSLKNGAETDVDCGGGSCGKCVDGKACSDGPRDCDSGLCMAGVCKTRSCSDNLKNGDESDVDCGGVTSTCPKCADGKVCADGPNDCASGVCGNNICAAPTCSDTAINGAETDLNCGGGTCPKCTDGQSCKNPSDCQGGVCTALKCVSAGCNDGVKNGTETDTDCGGTTCSKCKTGQICMVAGDCASNTCVGNLCIVPVPCDLDGDGFQRTDVAVGCPDAPYKASGKAIDCNDEDAGVFPGSTVMCANQEGGSPLCAQRGMCRTKNPDGTAQDTDCDGAPAKGCPTAMCDADGDGFVDLTKKAVCDPMNKLTLFDCNDADPTIYPAAPDKCGDAVAQNCTADKACGTDKDKDGYDDTVDCNDNDPAIHPWAVEVCDGKDNDCDGLIDEGNPDDKGLPLTQGMTVRKCNDSNVGECAQLTGHCICSAVSLSTLTFNQASRVACPGETATVDSSTASAARCYGGYQPKPQSCDSVDPKDDDCDGRVDDPTGTNLKQKGQLCWPTAKGVCAATMGGKVTGCDSSKANCFATAGVTPAVDPWLVCESTAVCPAPEKCNGLDDDCDGALPVSEQDTDGDGYIQCGSTDAKYRVAPFTCESTLKMGLKGCGDCADGDMTIHPGAPEVCDGADNDCLSVTLDGLDQCGVGVNATKPTCCGAQMACRNTQTDAMNCNGCSTGPNDHVCNSVRVDSCVSGGCSCGSLGSPCALRSYCASSACMPCNDATHCGDSCITCNGTTPRCKSDASGCVQCNTDPDCANVGTCGANGCFCNPASTCTAKSPLGTVCGIGKECLTGNCVDGVCCNQPQAMCNGCQACNVPTSVGTCKNVPLGQDPHGLCTASTPNCKSDNCDGNGTCNAADNVACGMPTCTNIAGTLTETDLVCGGGTCGTTMKSCAGMGCNGNVCFGSCTIGTDVGCTMTTYCVGGTMCVNKKGNGIACAAGNECSTGNCVQGQTTKLCSALTTCPTCQVINGAGTACTNATAGSDPKNECNASTASCKVDNCDGSGTCNAAQNASCGTTTCAAGVQTVLTCNASGACITTMPTCSNYACGAGGACKTSCASDMDCVTTAWCDMPLGTCKPKAANGVACSAGNQCSSGNCTQGQGGKLCAAVASCPLCQVVNLSGTACVNAGAGSDPKNECTASTASCKQDSCNGNGSCDVPDNTSCGIPSCSTAAGVSTEVDQVCTAGTCGSRNVNCAVNFACNGNVCYTMCSVTTDSGCLSTAYCATAATCSVKLSNGTPCTAANQCTTGNCIQAQSGMLCASVTSCGTCLVVNVSGSGCTAATPGSDPKSECTASVGNCKAASCDGSGTCNVANGTSCGTTTCNAGTQSVFTCNASGSCITTNPTCSGYGCNGGACKVSPCAGDNDCAPTNYCDATLRCSPQQATGTVCLTGSQCLSGLCVQGQASKICSSVATCTKCRVVDPTGSSCVNASPGSDPKNECTFVLATCQTDNCAGDGTCNAPSTTPCAADSCSGNTLTNKYCDSGANCTTATNPCANHLQCNGTTACKMSCGVDTDCVSGYWCNAGACTIKAVNGTVCTAPNQCSNNICGQAQNDKRCSSIATCPLCRVLDTAGATCINALTGTDPKTNDCVLNTATCTDTNCNGSGACLGLGSTTTCAAQVCSGSTLTPARLCSGTAGTCPNAAGSACDPYICANGTSCKTSCVSANDCIDSSSYTCAASLCKLVQGRSCTTNSQCASGFCTDGVCCDTSCSSACKECTTGTCINVPTGEFPVHGSCGNCGLCNGGGTCCTSIQCTPPNGACAL